MRRFSTNSGIDAGTKMSKSLAISQGNVRAKLTKDLSFSRKGEILCHSLSPENIYVAPSVSLAVSLVRMMHAQITNPQIVVPLGKKRSKMPLRRILKNELFYSPEGSSVIAD